MSPVGHLSFMSIVSFSEKSHAFTKGIFSTDGAGKPALSTEAQTRAMSARQCEPRSPRSPSPSKTARNTRLLHPLAHAQALVVPLHVEKQSLLVPSKEEIDVLL